MGLAVVALVPRLIAQVVTGHPVPHPLRGVADALRQTDDGDLPVHVAVFDGMAICLLQQGVNILVEVLLEHDRVRDLSSRQAGYAERRHENAVVTGPVDEAARRPELATLEPALLPAAADPGQAATATRAAS